ncbi:MAG: DUF2784 domain-containing protein [Candidatus Krumholzibacteriia bacterium]
MIPVDPGTRETLQRLAADAILAVHALFVAFVVIGQLAILIGLLARRRWARNFRFRVVHLACVLYVTVQTWLGITCPLTTWENALRATAGERGYEYGFIAGWLDRLIFYQAEPWVFTLLYSLFGVAVVVTWIAAPPRRR